MALLDTTSVTVELRQDHGFVLLVFMLTIFVHYWFMAVKVSQARKKFAVRYPALYADSSNKDANAFNCVQRGHQNSLEQLPHFLATFAVASLRYPLYASVAGLVYNVGKVVYCQGYSTGQPGARQRGSFSYFATISLYIMVFMHANSLLKLAR